jgi:Fe-S cluster biogenesis protein NfuA/nitrite reductase/ring-hydroxylating ferredoxin subunit
MGASPDVRQTGERIERLLEDLRSHADPPTVVAAEELVRSVVDLYGAGLERVVAVLDGTGELDRLVADPLVESLLLLHGLHPLGVDERIERALDQVRPYLGSHAGGVEYVGVDEDGVAHLRLHGSCDGCASSNRTVELAISGAVEAAAPEVTAIDVAGVTAPDRLPLLQIGPRPPDGVARPAGPAGWVLLSQQRPARDDLVTASVGELRVLVCDVRGALYAYTDACPMCGGSLADGALQDAGLGCPGCGTRYDVRRAGAALDGGSQHLDPVPLVVDGAGIHVAPAPAHPVPAVGVSG